MPSTPTNDNGELMESPLSGWSMSLTSSTGPQQQRKEKRHDEEHRRKGGRHYWGQ
jgi:hypothetical protein